QPRPTAPPSPSATPPASFSPTWPCAPPPSNPTRSAESLRRPSPSIGGSRRTVPALAPGKSLFGRSAREISTLRRTGVGDDSTEGDRGGHRLAPRGQSSLSSASFVFQTRAHPQPGRLPRPLRASREGAARLLGRACEDRPRLAQALLARPGGELPRRSVVLRRRARRHRDLHRPAPDHLEAEQGGHRMGRRTGRPPRPHLQRSRPRGLPLAAALLRLGVRTGDRVCIYLPMIPEAAIAMLACARIGAVHSVVFAGFSAEALRERILDAGAT